MCAWREGSLFVSIHCSIHLDCFIFSCLPSYIIVARTWTLNTRTSTWTIEQVSLIISILWLKLRALYYWYMSVPMVWACDTFNTQKVRRLNYNIRVLYDDNLLSIPLVDKFRRYLTGVFYSQNSVWTIFLIVNCEYWYGLLKLGYLRQD